MRSLIIHRATALALTALFAASPLANANQTDARAPTATGPVDPVFAAWSAAEVTPFEPDQAAEIGRVLAPNWANGGRFLVRNEVLLPLAMWFNNEYNRNARTSAFQVTAVLDCDPATRLTRRLDEVVCTIADIGLIASALPGDSGRLQPILEEYDQTLTGATLLLHTNHHGRIANVELRGVNKRNRRISLIQENLRLVLSRSIAGFDLPLPRGGALPNTGQWVENDSLLMKLPSTRGSAGLTQIANRVRGTTADGLIVIDTRGHGIVIPGEEGNNYDLELQSVSLFDPSTGLIAGRTWSVIGEPTASSQIASGFAGLPYVQRGTVRALSIDEVPYVGQTLEVAPPGDTPSALQQWLFLGGAPR